MKMTMQVFPSVCAMLGGAEWVKTGRGVALVKLPMSLEPVRLKLSDLPAPERWTSFNLADAGRRAVEVELLKADGLSTEEARAIAGETAAIASA